MENLPAVTSNEDAKSLKSDALEALRRVLYMADDSKTIVSVATKIIDSLKEDTQTQRPIVIKDSQIQMLVQVAKEAFGG